MTANQIPFLFLDRYPNTPAARPVDTSQEAAKAVEPTVAEYRQKVLAMLRHNDYTADEIASRMNRSVLYCRPRLSELRKMGLIEPSGVKRTNASGLKATVWRIRER